MGKTCRVKFTTKTFKKRRGFCGKKKEKKIEESVDVNTVNTSVNSDVNMESSSVSVNNDSVNISDVPTASERKIINIDIPVESTPTSSGKKVTGYRLFDMEILSFVLGTLSCPSCKANKLQLSEILSKKKGLASFLLLQCDFCSYTEEFYTSRQKDHLFDINARTVYSMRACGQGYAGLEKLTTLMNLPSPMTANNYDKIIRRLNTVTKDVAQITMSDACDEIRGDVPPDTIVNTPVSGDGTW